MTIHISRQHKSVVVPFSTALSQLFPHGQRFTYEGQDWIGLPHGIEETRLLRNMNLPVPAPIVEHYGFPSADGKRPFTKQLLTAASMVMNPKSYVLNGMGTGKTKSAIWAFDYLLGEGLVRRMLVVAPLSTLEFTWLREIKRTIPDMKVVVLSGLAARRRRLLNADADIYIVNHDGVGVIWRELLGRPDIDVICFDEASAYRNYRTERGKIARKVAQERKYVWGMTGSPTPTAPTDAYGLAHLITPGKAPKGFVRFRDETMLQVSDFRWVARKDATETVARLLQPAVRFSLDEIVELPPVIEREVEVPMTGRQRETYGALRDYAAALMKEGSITASNGGVVFSKMLQCSAGWVYGDRDREIIPMHGKDQPRLEDRVNPRVTALLDLIESAEHKVIAFAPFKNAIAGIAAALKDAGIDYAEVTGDTSPKERSEIFTAFQNTGKYKLLLAHPECMSHGLTLTNADTIIWFGPTTKLETWVQANARITRVGQTHKQQVIKLIGSPAERMIYRRLADKNQLQENILDLLAELTTGDLK